PQGGRGPVLLVAGPAHRPVVQGRPEVNQHEDVGLEAEADEAEGPPHLHDQVIHSGPEFALHDPPPERRGPPTSSRSWARTPFKLEVGYPDAISCNAPGY